MFAWCVVSDMGFPPRWRHLFNLIAFFCLVSLCCTPVFAQTLDYFCGRQQYYESSLFEQNLGMILQGIASNMDDNGYYTESRGTDANAVHVAALCRADTLLEDCQSCIRQAAEDIQQTCGNSMNAYWWLKWCMLRIWSSDMSWNEYDNLHPPTCSRGTTSNAAYPEIPETELSNLDTLLNDLAVNASSLGRTNFLMVAVGNFTGDPVIHSMAQCMPDLSPNDCDKCLHDAVQRRPQCLDDTLGTVILTPRCFLQYDTYQFYDSTRLQQVEDMHYNTPAPAPAPEPSTKTSPPPGWSISTPEKPFFPPPPPRPTDKESGPERSASKPGWIIPVAIAAPVAVLVLVGLAAAIRMKMRPPEPNPPAPVPGHETGTSSGPISTELHRRFLALKKWKPFSPNKGPLQNGQGIAVNSPSGTNSMGPTVNAPTRTPIHA